MAALAQPTIIPVGMIKSFGRTGPMYEVMSSAPPSRKGEMVHIKVVLTGEELDYPVEDMLGDPLVP